MMSQTLNPLSGLNVNFILNANQNETKNVLMDPEVKATGYTHVAIEVTDAESVIAQLAEFGISLSGELHQHPTGQSFFIRDPDLNVIEFIEYTGLEKLLAMGQN